MTTVGQIFSKPARFLRLRGPLAEDPTAKILNALLLGILFWSAAHAVLFLAHVVVRPVAGATLLVYQATACVIALVLLSRGALQQAATAYLCGVWVTATILVSFNGGIHSPVLVLFAAMPISAAWLLGYRAAVLITAASILFPLGMAVSEILGKPLPRYFTGTPLVLWSVFLLAIIIAALPVIAVVRTLNESLAWARRWIAELGEAQEALRRERDLVNRIMETSPVGIVALDREGRINFANHGAERIFGLSRDEATQRAYNDPAWQTTSHGGDPCSDNEYVFRQVQMRLASVHDLRIAIARPDGSRVLLSVNAAPVFTAEGAFDGMVAAMEDMTDRARVEAELRTYREHLEELVQQRTAELEVARDQALAANKAKTVFLANMSHELRTPLNSILGFSTLIGEAPGIPAEHLSKVRIIKRSGEHLLELIDEVLDMAKIEAGSITVENRPTDLNDLVGAVADMMRIRAEEKGLRVLVDRSASFPRFARLDGAKLRDILVNVMSNAIEHTEHGQVTLRLDAEIAESWLLKCEVIDTGVGIAAEDQERIFHPFVQVGSRHTKGTGLGLSITRQYVQSMGGAIALDSAPGRGSRFCVSLPAEAVDPDDAVQVARQGKRVLGLEPGQPTRRILVVEDHRENRALLQELLTAAGFSVEAVEDGAAAVKAFQLWRPHLIWMDWRLPVMDGRQATGAIRAMPGGDRVKIVAVTASVFSADRAAVLAAGVDEFVRKPFRPQDIFGCMGRLLGVRFTYGPEAAPPEQGRALVALTPDSFRNLPWRLREELARALISLDVPRVTGVIGRASEIDRDLAATLSRHADSLAFTAMLKALEAARESTREEAN